MNEDNELVVALQELQLAVRGLHGQQLELRDQLGELTTSSHLRSTLNLLKEDVAFRRMIYGE